MLVTIDKPIELIQPGKGNRSANRGHRPRIYANSTERVQAWRERHRVPTAVPQQVTLHDIALSMVQVPGWKDTPESVTEPLGECSESYSEFDR